MVIVVPAGHAKSKTPVDGEECRSVCLALPPHKPPKRINNHNHPFRAAGIITFGIVVSSFKES